MDDYPLAANVDDFINGRLISAEWGSWGGNVATWVYTPQDQSAFLLMRYEDMKMNTEQQLQRIVAFLGLEPTPERLKQVIEASSPERMQDGTDPIGPVGSHEKTSQGHPLCGSGHKRPMATGSGGGLRIEDRVDVGKSNVGARVSAGGQRSQPEASQQMKIQMAFLFS